MTCNQEVASRCNRADVPVAFIVLHLCCRQSGVPPKEIMLLMGKQAFTDKSSRVVTDK
jgi:hypothetical protein